MKRYYVLVLAVLVAALIGARAQGLDEQYVQIFNLIQEGDNLSDAQPAKALAKYADAQTALLRLQKSSPDWNPKVVAFRLAYVGAKIGALSTNAPTPAVVTLTETNRVPATATTSVPPTAAPANVPPTPALSPAQAELGAEVALLKEQVRQLQAERIVMEAKLKEALSVQPAEADPRELAKSEEKVRALQKENDLLKVALETQKTKSPASADTRSLDAARQALEDANRTLEREKNELQKKLDSANKALAGGKGKKAAASRVPQLESELAAARARLDVFEARQVPYSPEELALLKTPPTTLASTPSQPARKSTKELPRGSTRLVTEAQTWFASRQFDKAEAAYTEVVRMDPKNVPALANLAAVQIEAGHLDLAEKNVKTALAEDPEDPYSLYVFGIVKFRQAKYDESLDALSRAAKLDADNPEVQNYLGLALSEKGQRLPAETALRKAIQLRPNYGSAHYNLAIVYLSQQPPATELARWHYQKALTAGYTPNPDFEKRLQAK